MNGQKSLEEIRQQLGAIVQPTMLPHLESALSNMSEGELASLAKRLVATPEIHTFNCSTDTKSLD
jgi:hypothetical protein